MNLKTIVESIFEMEEDMDLFNKKIDGVYFWELIRFIVVSDITQMTGLYTQPHTELEINSAYIAQFIRKAIANLFFKNPFSTSASELLFLGHPRRKLGADGFWWDIYCDPVIDYIGKKYRTLLLEGTYLNTHLVPQKTDRIAYMDFSMFLGTLLRRLRIARIPKNQRDLDFLQNLQQRIQCEHGAEVEIITKLYQTLTYRKSVLPIYRTLLQRIRPKAVFILVSYDNEIFIEACKQLGIPTIEFQHGTFSRYHTGYSYPGNYAVKRRFPDYFLTFGDYWKNLIDLPIEKQKVISVGYPFFEIESQKYKNEVKKNQIVFISQGAIGEKLSRFAVNLHYKHGVTHDIIYKLHPGEYSRWRIAYPWLVNTCIRVIDDESEPLYRLLAQSKAQVGVFSTLLYEGLGMGLPTFLVDLPGIEYMVELIASGAVTKIAGVDDLIAALKNPQTKSVPDDRFFKPNALENISNALEKILQNIQQHCDHEVPPLLG